MSDKKTKETQTPKNAEDKEKQINKKESPSNNQDTKNKTAKPEQQKLEKKPLTKKKLWIIITSIVCAVVLIAVATTSIILVSRRKLDMTPTTTITYNNHTSLKVVSPANNVSVYNASNPTYYSNCTVLVENEDTNTYGIYSYVKNKQIIPTDYQFAKITPIELNNQGDNIQKHIFKVGNKFGEISNIISFYNDEGDNLNITHYDSEKDENFAYIKQRKVTISEKRKGIKVSTKDKFSDEKIYITNASYSTSYIVDGKYNYEVWNITAKDGTIYENLYKVENKSRTLVQTLNNIKGNSIELSDTELNIVFLKNNEPAFYTTTQVASISDNSLVNFTAYDINLNNIGSTEISTENLSSLFIVGNKIIFQFTTPCSEDKYDYSKTIDTSFGNTTTYYQLSTYSFNLKNGKYKEEKFDYLISDTNTSFNNETALLRVQEIKNKTLQDSQLLLINDYLSTKEISYDIDTITKITKDRYLVDNSKGQYLIDEKYNLVCYLGKYDSYFTTINAIMLSKISTGYTYVCSLDGIVVKQYLTDKITNTYDDKYYMVETTTKKEDGTYNEIYLESLGIRNKTPIYSQKEDSATYTYNGVEYVAYNDQILADGVSIITRVRKNGETYTYEFYNIDGNKLLQLDNFVSTNRVLTYWDYYDEDNILLYISTNVGGIGYTLMVDR